MERPREWPHGTQSEQLFGLSEPEKTPKHKDFYSMVPTHNGPLVTPQTTPQRATQETPQRILPGDGLGDSWRPAAFGRRPSTIGGGGLRPPPPMVDGSPTIPQTVSWEDPLGGLLGGSLGGRWGLVWGVTRGPFWVGTVE